MDILKTIETSDFVLTEAAVVETLRRGGRVQMHPQLEHAALIYEDPGRQAIREVYNGFFKIAAEAQIPMMICCPTWRASRNRVTEAGIQTDINGDAVRFMRALRPEETAMPQHPKPQNLMPQPLFLGGILGPQNDCYRPDLGLKPDQAHRYHAWQAQKLAGAGVDFLLAATLPALPEAIGMTRALADTGLPYFISFVINRTGTILDGTPLDQAFAVIDPDGPNPPAGYMINCAYPSFLNADQQPASAMDRLVGFQGNASSLDHDQLDGAAELQADSVSDWGDRMVALNQRFGVKILGGCCGTGVDHLNYLVEALKPAAV